MGKGAGIVPAVAQVVAMALVQSLAQEFPPAMGSAKKKKKKVYIHKNNHYENSIVLVVFHLCILPM